MKKKNADYYALITKIITNTTPNEVREKGEAAVNDFYEGLFEPVVEEYGVTHKEIKDDLTDIMMMQIMFNI